MNELTRTGFNRNKAFWFLILSPFILIIASLFKELNTEVLTSYFFFCFSVISAILGTKANDTYQKFKKGVENDKH